MLPRGQGTVTTTALSQDSVYLLVLAIKMACNILSNPSEMAACSKALLKTETGTSM